MAAIETFLSELSRLRVKLTAEGGQLRVKGAKEALTPELRRQLSGRKEEIIAFLRMIAPDPRAETIPRVARQERLPLSFAQRRLWFLHRYDRNESIAYHLPVALGLKGALDIDALARAVNAIANRHEVLRTTFPERDGQPFQEIATSIEIPLAVVDLDALPDACRQRELNALIEAETRRPFDLTRGPLLRQFLFLQGGDLSVFLFTLHHIVSDAWSANIFVAELNSGYAACRAGREPAQVASALQYADFAVWQSRYLSGATLEALQSFWKAHLQGAPDFLPLPTDHARPPARTFRGGAVPLPLDGPLQQRLLDLSGRIGMTLFTCIHAAFLTLLHRYTGECDLVVGVPFANRNRRETESLIGFFVNTLPIRTRLDGRLPWRTLAERVHEGMLAAQHHQDLPFEQIVKALAVPRDPSFHPLFQVLLVQEHAGGQVIRLAGLNGTLLPLEQTTAKFDLTLRLVDTGAGWEGCFRFNRDLFEAATVARMADHLHHLLAAVADSETTLLARLPLMDERERERILGAWNRTDVDFGPFRPVHLLIDDQARLTPDRIALVLDGEDLQAVTFAELNRLAATLRARLTGLGLVADMPVGLCLERSLPAVAALLAVLGTGAAVVPLDPGLPAERLAFMIREAGIGLVLAPESLNLADGPCRRVPLSRLLAEDAPAALPGLAEPHPLSCAYYLYTSGSTGQPKGVMVTHRGLFNYCCWMRRALPLAAGDRVLQKSPFHFDAFVWELFNPLIEGARVVLARPGTQGDTAYLAEAVARLGITQLKTPPSLLGPLLEEPAFSGAGLVRFFCGGEALPAALAKRFRKRFDAELINLYGPTEVTVNAAFHRVGATAGAETVALGRPIDNARVYILDSELQPVPAGVRGDLFVGGPGLARGYRNRPNLSAAAFLPDPFATSPGQRLYFTGDRAWYGADGTIHFAGRGDHQVKLRGLRLEPAEIETALKLMPGIDEAVVIMRAAASNRERHHLAAFHCGPGPVAPDEALIRRTLARTLPAYMIPASFTRLAALPRLSSGKIDRLALRHLDPVAKAGTDQPRSQAETRLKGIWARVLGLEHIGIHDNFFEIGGDSIVAIQVVSRARQAGLLFSPKMMFEHQTIARLAAAARPAAARPAAGIATERETVSGMAPLTPIQHRFLERSGERLRPFHQSVLLELAPSTQAAPMTAALGAVVRHHDALRQRLIRAEKVMVHAAAAAVTCPILDLSALSRPLQDRAMSRIAGALAGTLDLEAGPLIVAAFFVLDAGRRHLFLAIHHMVVDGVSWRILFEDLAAAYNRTAAGKPVDLPPRTTSFKTWSERLVAFAQENEAELRAWTAAFRRLPPAVLPRDRNLAPNDEYRPGLVTRSLSPQETVALLRHAPAAYHTQINDILLTGLARCLTSWTGSDAALIDLEGHGREELFDDLDTTRTIGWFTTLFPVLLQLPAAGDPGAALKAVKEQLRAIPNKGIGYGLLRYLGSPETRRKLCALPAADIVFNYLGQFDENLAWPPLVRFAVNTIDLHYTAAPLRGHPLQVTAAVVDGCLSVEWRYDRDCFMQATIAQRATAFMEELQTLSAHCLSPEAGGFTPSDFPLAHLDQALLDDLIDRGSDVADILPLTPVQQGLLYHCLETCDDTYVNQIGCAVEMEDPGAFRRAWETMVARHSILRTSFHWQQPGAPLQIVHERVDLDWYEADWRDLDSDQRQTQWQDYLAADRARGFDLDQVPLMRFALLRTGPRHFWFAWCHHHLLTDGWSVAIMARELAACYRAQTEPGAAQPLADARPFRDYIAWLAGRDAASATAFWRRELAGFDEPTPLPRHGATSLGGSRLEVIARELDAETTRACTRLVRQGHTTLFTLFEAAWALLLARYTDRRKVLFGTTLSGRPADLAGIEAMLGPFIVTVPLALELPDACPLVAWLQQLQQAQIEREGFTYLPLTAIRQQSELPAGIPFFETLLVFENYPVTSSLAGQESLRMTAVHNYERTGLPLVLSVQPGEQLRLQLHFETSHYDTAAGNELLTHLGNLILAMSADPDLPLRAFSLLTAEQRANLLDRCQGTRTTFDEPALLHRLFEGRRARHPAHTALLVDEPGSNIPVRMSYAELDDRAEALAAALLAAGAGPGDRLGVCLPPSADLIVSMMAVLKTGAAFVPFDPAVPDRRLAFCCEDAGIRILLSDAAGRRTPASVRVLHPAALPWTAPPDRRRTLPCHAVSPAYVAYTSGTTGTPKGVVIGHGALANHLHWLERAFPLEPHDRLLQLATPAFDAALWEIFTSLCHGAQLVLPRPDGRGDPTYLADLVRRCKVTRMLVVPSFLNALLQVNPQPDLSSLRLLFVGGEPAEAAILQRLRACSAAKVVNFYGPTEAAVAVSTWQIPEPFADPIPIGTPIDNHGFLLMDSGGRVVPAHVPGELFIAGAGLAQGYLNRPDLSAAAFLPDPFALEPGSRLYRSGDRASMDEEGRCLFLGRTDGQVKVRGLRIELGEIEATLRAFPAVVQAAVLLLERRLVAFVAAPGVEESELKRFVASRLPDYMMPVRCCFLADWPTTTSGKTDRRRLAALELSVPHHDHTPPRTEPERQLCRIWGEVLGLEQVGIDDPFFEIGGDSIMSIQIMARARQAGLLLRPSQFFSHPTIRALATIAEPIATAPASAERKPFAGSAPLTPMQHWFFERNLPDPHHFNQSIMLALADTPSPQVLEAALAALVDHHDALRLRFPANPTCGLIDRQICTPPGDFRLACRHLEAGESPERAAAREQASLDLENGPLFRAILFSGCPPVARHPAFTRRLLLVCHHLIVDTVSWRILLADLATATAAATATAGRLPDLPARTTSFPAWAERLPALTASAMADLPYWREVYAGDEAEAADFPADPGSAGAAETLTTSLDEALSQRLLREANAAFRTRTEDLLLAALRQALDDRAGTTRRIDLEAHGREDVFADEDLSRTVGWFTVLYPLKLAKNFGDDPIAGLKAVKEQLRAVPRHGLGHGLLVRAGQLAARPAGILFNYLGQVDRALQLPGAWLPAPESAGPATSPRNPRSHALEINAIILDGRLRIDWTFHPEQRRAIRALAGRYRSALEALVEFCTRADAGGLTPSDVPLSGLDQVQLDRFRGREIEDIYPLSPLQEGLLFQSLMTAGEGNYFQQMHCLFSGALDPDRWRAAWRRLIERHTILRTGFRWQELPRPLQMVFRRATPEWHLADWSDKSAAAADADWAHWLDQDRARGFNLETAPLMRFTLVRLAGDRHRFAWSFHHLLIDGWSATILIDECLAAYAGSGEPAGIAKPYRDYIAWLAQRDDAEADAFWAGEMSGFQAPVPFPPGQSAAMKANPIRSTHLVLDDDLSAACERMARRRLTLANLLQAAWALLLSRYAGRRDILFGATHSGRPAELPGIESMVGLFINTVPVRILIDGSTRLGPWLERLQQRQVARAHHCHLPLTRIHEFSEVPAGQPLFETLFVLENYPAGRNTGSAGTVTVSEVRVAERTHYPLVLTATPGPPIRLQLHCRAGSFEESIAEHLLAALSQLLRAFTTQPEARLDEISLLDPERRRLLLETWNQSGAEAPSHLCLHELFLARAEAHPDRAALIEDDSGRVVTYGDLAGESAALAGRLAARGIGPETCVGVYIPRSAAMVAAALAVLRAGGTFLPLHAGLPPGRLAFMLTNSGTRLVLTDSDAAPDFGPGIEVLDSRADGDQTRPQAPLPSHIAYLIYTSGSTGEPKGVAIPHRAVAHYLQTQGQTYAIGAADRVLQVANPCFDASIWEQFIALTSGATLVIARSGAAADAGYLSDVLERRKITIALLITPILAALTAERARTQAAREAEPAQPVHRLRLLFTGGEKLPAAQAHQAAGLAEALVNYYGPSETTVTAAAWIWREATADPLPIGRPLTAMRLYILDSAMRPLPVGAPGELLIGGPNLARGYCSRPDLTAAGFVPDPFVRNPRERGSRLYRTGDLVRHAASGEVVFLGRVDSQVKLRGVRIELAEIEAALCRHRQVSAAAVLALNDGPPQLMAFVTGAGLPAHEPELATRLRAFLADWLVSTMIPARYRLLPALPLTTATKVDRRALEELVPATDTSGMESPATAEEEIMCGLWADALSCDRVTPADDFFGLGGHSLIATRLVSRIRQAFAVDLPLTALFETPGVADLSARVARLRRDRQGQAASPVVPVSREHRTYPLSHAQRRLWFLDQLQEAGGAYHIATNLDIRGPLRIAPLARALAALIARHESLRTRFPDEDGLPRQVIEPSVPFRLAVSDLRALAEAETLARRLARRHGELPFSLSTGPLFRAHLSLLEEGRARLSVSLHHIIADGWSLSILVRELTKLYRDPLDPTLPELPVQYADYADWQETWLAGPACAAQYAYWRRKLADVPPLLELPTDRFRPSQSTGRGALVAYHLDADTSLALHALARRHQATLYMVLEAAFAILLARYSGQRDLVVGSPVANRTQGETEGIIGFFVNTLPIRNDLAGNPGFTDFLLRVRAAMLEAFTCQDVPFSYLVERLNPVRATDHQPLVQVLLALQNLPNGALDLQELAIAPVDIERASAKFDLSLLLNERDDGLSGVFEYSTDLFEEPTIAHMGRQFTELLQALVGDPLERIHDLPLMTAAEQRRLLEDGNATGRDYPRVSGVHDLVSQVAARRPDAIALVGPEPAQVLSYAELDRQARHLARQLLAHGAGPQQSIALLMTRSPQMVIALLAILHTHGSYVPLDLRGPDTRNRFLLEDTAAALLLTDRQSREKCPACTIPVLEVEALPQASAAVPLPSGFHPDLAAYVAYTSGSTGTPKGAVIPHRAVVRLLVGIEYVDFTRVSALLQMAPLSFDAATFEIWGALLHGARLVLCPEGTPSLEMLAEVLAAHRPDLLWLTASFFNLVIDQDPSLLRDVRQLLVGGEALSPAHVARARAALPAMHLINGYGPTEATTFTCCHPIEARPPVDAAVPIGRPIANTRVYLLDRLGRPVAAGVPGELYIGGDGLALGYLNRPRQTAAAFLPDPFAGDDRAGARLYRSGDRARYLSSGAIHFLGRTDEQVKLRGYRIEPGEIEACLKAHGRVSEAAVSLRRIADDARLVAHIESREEPPVSAQELRDWLKVRLPDYMIPAAFLIEPALPRTSSGKLDRRTLAARQLPDPEEAALRPSGPSQQWIATIWGRLLGVAGVDPTANFFDLGGHSLLLIRVQREINARVAAPISVMDLFRHPTVASLAALLDGRGQPAVPAESTATRLPAGRLPASATGAIAVIGYAGRFPGAADIAAFWQNLRDGVESIRFFSEAELLAEGLPPGLVRAPDYVRASGYLADSDHFDAAFFDISPAEAELMDPQHRLFLEEAWHALEDAGYAGARPATGVFAGLDGNAYLLNGLLENRDLLTKADPFRIHLANQNDFLATRVAYKLDLKGPGLTVQTACSTSLAAVHLACRALIQGECELALAGGVSVAVPPKSGYRHTPGSISSPDGHCRTFDADAAGTVSGSGVGVVVLKRLERALADGDTIHAVIRGSAMNNDGSAKPGYTAPSVAGQRDVILAALRAAQIAPNTIGYVEAHGTATPMGDPIEFHALAEAYQAAGGAPAGSVALGSAKSNIGHLGAAAGVAGLIKVCLQLEHGELVPSLHFRQPNPAIDFAGTPFQVNTRHRPWPAEGQQPVRRAAVSSFGIGGTNVHAVLESPPARAEAPAEPGPHLLLLSAKSPSARDELTRQLQRHLARHPDLNPADLAYSLQVGRAHLPLRRCLVFQDSGDALTGLGQARYRSGHAPPAASPTAVAFLFPGQDAIAAADIAALYDREPVFRRELDRCSEILATWSLPPLRELLEGRQHLSTDLAQPTLFSVCIALARLWGARGITPAAMIGHSLGEFAAACLAGVFSLEDALALLVRRGRLMAATVPGAMLAVACGEAAAAPYLGKGCSLAAVNGPDRCVLAGNVSAIAQVRNALERAQIACKLLPADHAFHSAQMDPVVAPLHQHLAAINLNRPRIPFISSVTGTWISDSQATDPSYWADQVRAPVRFGEGLRLLARETSTLLLEVGPGRTLAGLAGKRAPGSASQPALAPGCDPARLLDCLGRLWLAGADITWEGLHPSANRRRLPLPTYPFERRRFWLAAPAREHAPAEREQVAPAGAIRMTLREPARIHTSAESIAAELNAALTDRLASPRNGAESSTDSDGLASRALAHVFRAFRELGWSYAPGRCFRTEQVAEALQIPQKRLAYLSLLLDMLARSGYLEREGETWRVARILGEDPAPEPAGGDERHALLERCGGHLAEILGGRIDSLELLFPDGDASALDRLYREVPAARSANSLLADGLAKAVAGGETTVRILEAGAGTGASTAALLPILAPAASRYWFTDVSAYFTKRAQEKFGDYDFVRYLTLDLEQDPADQGFAPNSVDIVVAANVVHATSDPGQALSHIRRLLAPGGLVFLLEGTRRSHFSDLVFGGLAGWTSASGTKTSTSPALTAAAWCRLLAARGFDRVASVPPAKSDPGMAIIMAHAAPEPLARGGHQLIFADAGGLGRELAHRFAEVGIASTLIRPGKSYARLKNGNVRIDPASGNDFRRLLEETRGGGAVEGAVEGAVLLWGLDALAAGTRSIDALAVIQARITHAAEHLAALLPRNSEGDRNGEKAIDLWLVTRQAGGGKADENPRVDSRGPRGLVQLAMVRSAERALAAGVSLRHLDLPAVAAADEARLLAATLMHPPGEAMPVVTRPAAIVAPQEAGIPPRNPEETAVIAILQRLLGLEAIGRDDDFFEMGGDSLIGIQLLSQLRQTFQLDAAAADTPVLGDLLKFRTAADLARLVRQRKPRHSPLIAMTRASQGNPLFLVHPGGGNVLCYEALSRHLATVPIYAIQAPGLRDEEQPLDDIAAMAANYLAAVRRLRPRGPYRLAGWCSGGLIAYEMARQIEAAGDSTETVILIDTWATWCGRPIDELDMMRVFALDLGRLAAAELELGREELEATDESGRLALILARATAAGILPGDFDARALRRMWSVFRANQKAIGGYRPQPRGALAVLIATERPGDAAGGDGHDGHNGWSRFGIELPSVRLSGDHYSLLRPPRVAALADSIARWLDSTHGGQGTSK